ncbi:MAG: DUF4011 domain-containing protein [Ardenticatenaceae bacterium]|nr:DUF4011 domain-containing protein [Ardenticatenaceae bacterium]
MRENAKLSRIDQLKLARQELLDLGGRNPLINFRPQKTRGLNFVQTTPSKIFRHLVGDKGAYYFQPKDHPNGQQNEISYLVTPYTTQELARRLEHSYYSARTINQEQGINVLYVALGMLHWDDPESAQTYKAPLVLIPVQFERTLTLEQYNIRFNGTDVESNLSLIYKLQQDFGLTLPPLPDDEYFDLDRYFSDVQDAIQIYESWGVERETAVLGFFSYTRLLLYNDLDLDQWPAGSRPTEHPVLRSLLSSDLPVQSAAAMSREGHIDERFDYRQSHLIFDADSTQLEAIEAVQQGQNLVIQGPPGTGKSQTIANLIAQSVGDGKTVLFVAEKMAALDVVQQRLENVGLGPAVLELHSHKTTRVQVIDNMRETLTLGEPRSDGFFPELDELIDLRRQLNAYSQVMNSPVGESGLAPYDLFGRLVGAASQETFTLLPSHAFWSAQQYLENVSIIEAIDGWLRAHGALALHPLNGSRVMGASDDQVKQFGEGAAAADKAFKTFVNHLNRLLSALGIKKEVTLHQAEQIIAFADRLQNAPYLIGLKVDDPRWLQNEEKITEALHAGERIMQLREKYDHLVIEQAWQHPLLEVRGALMTARDRFLARFSGSVRQAERTLAGLCRGEVPKAINDRLALVDAILEVQRLSPSVEKEFSLLAQLFGKQWLGWDSSWVELNQAGLWLMSTYQDFADGEIPAELVGYLSEGLTYDQRAELAPLVSRARESLTRFRTRFTAYCDLGRIDQQAWWQLRPADLAQRLGRSMGDRKMLLHMVAINQHLSRLGENQLAGVASWVNDWRIGAGSLVKRFEQEWHQLLLRRSFEERPLLTDFDGQKHQAAIERFRELDVAFLRHNRRRLAYKHWQKLPKKTDFGRLGLLWREVNKKRGHRPIRELLELSGPAVQTIKPVFMMSPLSVAKYLSPGKIEFDLVIFDEASQVRPVDAFGAILRGKQVVVVGDSRQLPPTSFFERVVESNFDREEFWENGEQLEEKNTGNTESILDLFALRQTPQKMLRWHYRSQHESLIAVSNQEFYGSNLVLFPSPDEGRREVGLKLNFDPASVYDRGGSRTNPAEAEQVAAAVIQHALDRPHLTLGVATFSLPQRHAIDRAVQRQLRNHPEALPFFENHGHEPFFVKNLENVQGDERDIIFISVGYGRDGGGHVSLNFGPLNAVGGERRLNVLITRARLRCEVFTNLRAEDIDSRRTQSIGVQALKRYLDFAATGRLPDYGGYERQLTDPFADVVIQSLTAAGHEIERRVGLGGIEVDLAVRSRGDWGRFAAGIELDGRDYARAHSASERDRLQQAVLGRLGWKIVRAWASEWHKDRQNQEALLRESVHLFAHSENDDRWMSLLVPSQQQIERYDGGKVRPNKQADLNPVNSKATRQQISQIHEKELQKVMVHLADLGHGISPAELILATGKAWKISPFGQDEKKQVADIAVDLLQNGRLIFDGMWLERPKNTPSKFDQTLLEEGVNQLKAAAQGRSGKKKIVEDDFEAKLRHRLTPYTIATEPFDISQSENWMLHGPTKAYHSKVAFRLDALSGRYIGQKPLNLKQSKPKILQQGLFSRPPTSLKQGIIFATLQLSLTSNKFATNQLFFHEQSTGDCYRLVQLLGEKGYFIVTHVDRFLNVEQRKHRNQTIKVRPFDPSSGQIGRRERSFYIEFGQHFYSAAIWEAIYPQMPVIERIVEVDKAIERQCFEPAEKYVADLIRQEGPIKASALRDRVMNARSLHGLRFDVRKFLLNWGLAADSIVKKGDFYFINGQPIPIRDRSDLKTYTFMRRLEFVSDQEILAALALIDELAPSLPTDRKPAQLTRILGSTRNTKDRKERILQLATNGVYQPPEPADDEKTAEINLFEEDVIPYPADDPPILLGRRPGWQLIHSAFVSQNLYEYDPAGRTFGPISDLNQEEFKSVIEKPRKIPEGKIVGRLCYHPAGGEFSIHELFLVPDSEINKFGEKNVYRIMLVSNLKHPRIITQLVKPPVFRHNSSRFFIEATVKAASFDPLKRTYTGRVQRQLIRQPRLNKRAFPGDDIIHPNAKFTVSELLAVEMSKLDELFLAAQVTQHGPVRLRQIEAFENRQIGRYQFLAFMKRVAEQSSAFNNDGEFYWLKSRPVQVRSRANLRYDSELRKLENISDIELVVALKVLAKVKPDSPLEDRPQELFEMMGLFRLTAKRKKRVLDLAQNLDSSSSNLSSPLEKDG